MARESSGFAAHRDSRRFPPTGCSYTTTMMTCEGTMGVLFRIHTSSRAWLQRLKRASERQVRCCGQRSSRGLHAGCRGDDVLLGCTSESPASIGCAPTSLFVHSAHSVIKSRACVLRVAERAPMRRMRPMMMMHCASDKQWILLLLQHIKQRVAQKTRRRQPHARRCSFLPSSPRPAVFARCACIWLFFTKSGADRGPIRRTPPNLQPPPIAPFFS